MAFPIVPLIRILIMAIPDIISAIKNAPRGKRKEAAKNKAVAIASRLRGKSVA